MLEQKWHIAMVIRLVSVFLSLWVLPFAEKGQTKYKIHFEEKGKKRVSAHHIAFDHSPKVQQLCVGARVVVKTQANPRHFRPGILAEMPDRKNKMRCVFRAFTDESFFSRYKLTVNLCFSQVVWKLFLFFFFPFSRFLVFFDDHKPSYVSLPVIHRVCRPRKFRSFSCHNCSWGVWFQWW